VRLISEVKKKEEIFEAVKPEDYKYVSSLRSQMGLMCAETISRCHFVFIASDV